MKRRTFLKNTGTLSLAALITPSGIFHVKGAPAASSILEDNFKSPPWSARPHTWWHWMNGNVTKEGITLDLEAMARIGLGGFQNFDAGTGIPKGSVEYLSPEWLELKKHAIREADRLGLEFTMHNCPGWSSSGGPWITPDLAMQEVTWSELVVKGGKEISTKLPQPLQRLGYYKDIKVIAYKSQDGEAPLSTIIKKCRSGNVEVSTAQLTGESTQPILVQPVSASESGFLQIDFLSPQSIQHVSYRTVNKEGQRGPIVLQCSSDGKIFTDVATFNRPSGFGSVDGEIMTDQNVSPFQCISVRFSCSQPRELSHICFSNTPRANDWAKRANYVFNRYGVDDLSGGTAIVQSDIVDVTSFMREDGSLVWAAPTGNWTILRFGFTPIGTLNRSAPDTGVGLECNKYSATAIEFHFNKMMENLMPSLQTLRTKGKVGLLIDSYEVGMQNWTYGFEEIFRLKNQYAITKFLPAITGRLVDDADATERFLWDFRRTQGDLIAENYYEHFTSLCHRSNIISYCQPYDRGPMEEMQIGGKVDTNVGEFWNGLSSIFQNNWTMRRTVKLSASIAHTNGQKIVAAESYTGEPESSKWQEYPFGLKALGDKMYTQGLNRMIFHRFAHQPHPTAKPGMTMGPWGSHFDRTNTWWEQGRAWMDYLSRCQYLLQEGSFVADVAYFTGEDAGVYTRVERNELNPMPPEGYEYDLINADNLKFAQVDDGRRLTLSNGMSYRLLVLQDFERMSLELLTHIEKLVNQGLVVIGAAPKKSPGFRSGEESEFKAIVKLLWGTDVNEVTDRGVGEGRVVWGRSIRTVLKEMGINEDFKFTSRSGDAPVLYVHRRRENEDIFFLSNQRRTKEDLVCEFRLTGKQPERWDPVTGEIYPLSIFSFEAGKTVVPISLPESGSVFIVFRKNVTESKVRQIQKDDAVVLSTKPFQEERKVFPGVKDNFTISFWAKPESHVMLSTNNFMDGQKPWTDYFTIYPSPGETLYGANHATCGLAVGRNGIAVWEHLKDKPQFSFSIQKHLSGWSHIVLRYEEGKPAVFINGALAKEGPPSAFTVHPGFGHVFLAEGASFYNGDLRDIQLHEKVLTSEEIESLSKVRPEMRIGQVNAVVDRGTEWQFFLKGNYRIEDASGKSSLHKVNKLNILDLSSSWLVLFPEEHGAPKSLELHSLLPLNEHEDHGVKYFSGTCTYTRDFDFSVEKRKAFRYFLDLGSVEVLAEVMLNGKSVGTLWTRPFMADITSALMKGRNRLEIRVTNLWPNRLIGDEQVAEPYRYADGAGGSGFASLSGGAILELPEWYKNGKLKPDDGRVAFATWKHYTKDSPLLPSGLVGPVVIRTAEVKQI